MTHALNELIYGGSYNINDSEYLDNLGSEIRNTADEIRTKEASPETVQAITMAVDVLMRTEAAPFQKLYPVMEAAAVTGDPLLLEAADKVLNSAYPVGKTTDPRVKEINERSRRELHMAMNRTSRVRDFGHAVAVSEALHDTRTEDDFDTNIQISNWLTKEQRGTITDKERQDLHELLRRREERQKLEALGVIDDKSFDDAQPYNPFTDDDRSVEFVAAAA